jgi:hypothetical protein
MVVVVEVTLPMEVMIEAVLIEVKLLVVMEVTEVLTGLR